MEAATVAAEVARLRNLQTGHIRAQRRIRQDIDKLLGDADRSEERAGALEAIAEHAAGRDPVLTSYGGRPLADRGAIAKALAGAAATSLQQGTRQHLGQWCGLSVEVAPTQTWGASALEVTVRVAYRHAASFECPKSWLQQGQQWRILAGLEQLVQTAPDPGGRAARRRHGGTVAGHRQPGSARPALRARRRACSRPGPPAADRGGHARPGNRGRARARRPVQLGSRIPVVGPAGAEPLPPVRSAVIALGRPRQPAVGGVALSHPAPASCEAGCHESPARARCAGWRAPRLHGRAARQGAPRAASGRPASPEAIHG
jgi:hypothetical protein